VRLIHINRGTCTTITSDEKVDLIGVLTIPALFAPSMDADKLGLIASDGLLLLNRLLDVVTNGPDPMLGAARLDIAS
jgi:hypothetical protein